MQTATETEEESTPDDAVASRLFSIQVEKASIDSTRWTYMKLELVFDRVAYIENLNARHSSGVIYRIKNFFQLTIRL